MTEEAVGLEPDAADPRDRERQVADVVAGLCSRHREGEPAVEALRAVLTNTTAPVGMELLEAVALDPPGGLHRLARRWGSPMLATLADSLGGDDDRDDVLNVDYLSAVAAATAVEHRGPARLAQKRLRHPRHGLPWDEDEDQRLLAAFGQGATVEALCEQHQRNGNAIRARLVKHGVMEDEPPPATTGKLGPSGIADPLEAPWGSLVLSRAMAAGRYLRIDAFRTAGPEAGASPPWA